MGASTSHQTAYSPASVNDGGVADHSPSGCAAPAAPTAYFTVAPSIPDATDTPTPCAAPSYVPEYPVTVTSPGAKGASLPVTSNTAVSTLPATPFVNVVCVSVYVPFCSTPHASSPSPVNPSTSVTPSCVIVTVAPSMPSQIVEYNIISSPELSRVPVRESIATGAASAAHNASARSAPATASGLRSPSVFDRVLTRRKPKP